MEKIEILLSIAATAVGLAITTITFLSKFIKSARAKKVAENVVKIGNILLPYIEQAEKFVSFTGEEKKAYVMTKANQFAIENGIKFEAEKTSAKIDEIVALCKEVNVKNSPEKVANKEDEISFRAETKESYNTAVATGSGYKQKTIIRY